MEINKKKSKTKYYFLIMNQFDFFYDQCLEEILRERSAYYLDKKREIDFWILLNPFFLNYFKKSIQISNYFKENQKKIKDNFGNNYYSVLITQDKDFYSWMMLRIGYFEKIEIDSFKFSKDIQFNTVQSSESSSTNSFEFLNLKDAELNPYDIKSSIDGLAGIFEIENFINPLKHNKVDIHPFLTAKKIKKQLEMYQFLKNFKSS
jgi:hypothetical protein